MAGSAEIQLPAAEDTTSHQPSSPLPDLTDRELSPAIDTQQGLEEVQQNTLLLPQGEQVQPQPQTNARRIADLTPSKDAPGSILAQSFYALKPPGFLLRAPASTDDTPRPHRSFNFTMSAFHPARTPRSASPVSGDPKTPLNANPLPDHSGPALVDENNQLPLVYHARYPGPWNDHMRTPFTKRVNADGRVYLTGSPGNNIQEAPQPMPLENDRDTITNEEWSIIQAAKKRLAKSRNPAHVEGHILGRALLSEESEGGLTESDASPGSSDEYRPSGAPIDTVCSERARSIASDVELEPNTRLTALQKGKGRGTEKKGQSRDTDAISPSAGPPYSADITGTTKSTAKGRPGRLSKSTLATFKDFGESTRQAAHNLADLHGVNFATVMRYAALGAGSASRAPSDFNTFQTIYAAQVLAATECAFAPLISPSP